MCDFGVSLGRGEESEEEDEETDRRAGAEKTGTLNRYGGPRPRVSHSLSPLFPESHRTARNYAAIPARGLCFPVLPCPSLAGN